MKNKTIEILIIGLLFGLTIGFVFVHKNQNRTKNDVFEFEIFCDFEKRDNNNQFITNNPKYQFQNGETSNNISYSSNTSLFIPKWKKFQSIIELVNIQPSSYITIKLKKHQSSDASIVVQGKTTKDFYHITNSPVSSLNDGWEEILLKLNTDIDFKDTLKVYIYNKTEKDTYIDDVQISVSKESYYPQYKNEEPLLIYIEPKEMTKLNNKRKEAIEKGILQTDDDSWVNALIYGNGQMMQAEVRLKGDWLDHLKGDKWSFRIKLKNTSWKGMRVFSIQNPLVRGFTNEWIMHYTCRDEDILTTRYDFVPVYLNGKSIGIYAYEEHFQKELIEFSKRREGPIIKFSETDFWEFFLNKTPNDFAYTASVIEPFGTNNILEDEIKYNQFLIAANLLDMYRNLTANASDIFDVKKMAKFVSFVNSRNAFHALQWHNVRYYYNPVLCRLEPIAFDMFAGTEEFTFENPISPMITYSDYNRVKNSLYYLSSDSIFRKEYLKYLEEFINEKSYHNYKKRYYNDYIRRDSLQKEEFFPFRCNTVQFDSVIQKINVWLPAYKDSLAKETYLDRIDNLQNLPAYTNGIKNIETMADKYVKVFTESDKTLHIKCYLQSNISIIGLGNDKEIKLPLDLKVLNKDSGYFQDQFFTIDQNINDFNKLYFKVEGLTATFAAEITPWPAPTTYNPRNDIAENATDLTQYTDLQTKEIHFSGNLNFNNHVYTPIGYTIIIEAGTNINITNNAAFIINSNVIANGTPENPIKVYSSDGSANGFTILQAEEKSILKNIYFDNLNTLDYNYWTLTGAVTFYESDVELYNCKFTNNHCEDMLNTVRSDFYIKNCTIENTFGDSHDSDFCTGTLDNCTFNNNGNDAIDFSTSEVVIKSCNINGAGDKGISVGENTKAEIINIDINNVNIGIASKDLSHADIDGCKINNAKYGFLLLQKKPEFGPATITAKSCTLTEVWTESLIEKYSTLILNGKTYKGKKQKLKALFYE